MPYLSTLVIELFGFIGDNSQNMSQNIKKVIADLIGFKPNYNKGDFNIIYLGVLGYNANYRETEIIFKGKEEINEQSLVSFFLHKLAYSWDPELKALELFQNLDQNGKYFITKEDVISAWKEVDSKLTLRNLLECFESLTTENTLDYFTFKNVYLQNVLQPTTGSVKKHRTEREEPRNMEFGQW